MEVERWVFVVLLLAWTEGKGFSSGRGGGGGGGGFKGGSRGSGTFGGSASHNRPSSFGNNAGRSGSSFKGKAMSFAMGAAGGVAAYSLMRSMSGSYHSGRGHYGPGYGGK